MVIKQLKHIIFFIFTIALLQCSEPPLKNGEYIEITDTLETFTSIDFLNLFDITLIQDSIHFVTLKGSDKFISAVTLNIDTTNKLFIDYNVSNSWLREYEHPQIEVHFENVNRIDLREPCNIFAPDTLKLSHISLIDWSKFSNSHIKLNVGSINFAVSFDNAGIYIFEGKSDYSSFWIRGSSSLDAKNFISKKASVNQQSIGTCSVYARDTLFIDQYRKGKILYNNSVLDTVIINAPYPGLIYSY